MSLINQVLRDLESRHSEHDKPKMFSGVVPAIEADDTGMPWPVFTVLMLLAAIIAFAGLRYWHQRWLVTKNHQHTIAMAKLDKTHQYKMAKLKHSQPKIIKQEIKKPRIKRITVLHDSLKQSTKPKWHKPKKVKKVIRMPKLSKKTKEKLLISTAQAKRYKKALKKSMHKAVKKIKPFKVAAVKSKNIVIEKKTLSDANISMVKTELPPSPLAKADVLYERVLPLIEKGMYTKAVAQLKSLLKTFPEYRPGRMALAELLNRQHRHKESIAELEIGLKHSPQYSPFAELLAHLLIKQGKMKEALEVLSKTEPKLRDNPDYYSMMAGLNERLGRYNAAIELYQALLHFNPDHGVWWMGLGISYEGKNATKSALNAYKKALSSDSLRPGLQNYVENRINALEN